MGIFRRCCLLCGRSGEPLCGVCARRLPPPPSTRVRGVGRVPALFAYEGAGASVVQALKFRDGRRLVTTLADGLALDPPPTDGLLCTWLPTSASRRRERGFDQSELLARAVARRLRVPTARVLERRSGTAQTGQTRERREVNVQFSSVRNVAGRPLLVIDDVCTTGATIRAAAAALHAAHAGPLHFRTVARTP